MIFEPTIKQAEKNWTIYGKTFEAYWNQIFVIKSNDAVFKDL